MEKKNPMLAGLLNVLVPGLGSWYVDHDRSRFVKTLIVGIAAIAALTGVGTIIQSTTGFPMPQGLCIGLLLLIVLVPLFQSGHKTAINHNFVQDNAVMFTARQHGSDEAQLDRNQHLRDKGYISEQEYDSRKDSITAKKP